MVEKFKKLVTGNINLYSGWKYLSKCPDEFYNPVFWFITALWLKPKYYKLQSLRPQRRPLRPGFGQLEPRFFGAEQRWPLWPGVGQLGPRFFGLKLILFSPPILAIFHYFLYYFSDFKCCYVRLLNTVLRCRLTFFAIKTPERIELIPKLIFILNPQNYLGLLHNLKLD